MKKRIIFMGTPVFPVPILEELITCGEYDVVAVVSQPDKLVGRKKVLRKTPIKEVAEKYGIPTIQPKNIKKDYKDILEHNPDIIITAAYGQIVPNELLEYPEYGCINVHGSLLPKLRGGAPIHKSILYGHEKTGVTIMYMVNKMDAGDMISKREFPIDILDNVGTVHDKMQVVGKELLMETLPKIFSKNINPIKQNKDDVTYAWNITREEEKIDFNKTSLEVYNHIRAFNPWPVAYTKFNNKILKVLEAEFFKKEIKEKPGTIVKIDGKLGITTIDGYIVLKLVKPEGKKEMLFKDFLNGNKDKFIEGSKME